MPSRLAVCPPHRYILPPRTAANAGADEIGVCARCGCKKVIATYADWSAVAEAGWV